MATRINNFNGVVNLSATFAGQGNCATAVTIPVIVGTGISDPLFEQKTITCISGSQYSILARVTQAPGAATYRWYVGSSSGTNFVLKNTTTSNSATVGGGNPDNLYHILRVDITNSCNLAPISTANPEGRYKASCTGGGGGTFSVFPNPTSSELKIEYTDESGLETSELADPIELILYDQFQMKLRSARTKDRIVTIPTEGLVSGNYYLHIVTKDGLIQRRIRIDK